MKFAITCLALALFWAGAAFQEATTGLGWNHPDGGAGSMIAAIYFFILGERLVTKLRALRAGK